MSQTQREQTLAAYLGCREGAARRHCLQSVLDLQQLANGGEVVRRNCIALFACLQYERRGKMALLTRTKARNGDANTPCLQVVILSTGQVVFQGG